MQNVHVVRLENEPKASVNHFIESLDEIVFTRFSFVFAPDI